LSCRTIAECREVGAIEQFIDVRAAFRLALPKEPSEKVDILATDLQNSA
jgi:hypothetical protein